MSFAEGHSDEIAEKDRRIQALLSEQDWGGLVLSHTHHFGWATGGRDNHVVKGTDGGVGHALYTADGGKYLLCDNIEAGRLRDEEELEAQGFVFVTGPWYAFDWVGEARKLVGGKPLASDLPLGGDTVLAGGHTLAPLRYTLTPSEVTRYRWLGQTATQAMETTAQVIEPGMTEFEVEAVLDHFLEDEGITPYLTLVASDERIAKYRHPIPTSKAVDKYVMYVTCASAYGLIACITRLVYFGKTPADLVKRHEAACYIDTVMNLSTVPGASVAEIFARTQAAYAEKGFPEEWTLHHQGGATGYAGRDYMARPGSAEIVQPLQAFAWNPSITGTKTEDTIIATPDGPDFLTAPTDGWPTQWFETPYGGLNRPLILER